MRASNESRKQSSRKSRGERVQGQGQQQEDKSARAIGATKHNDRPRFRLNFSSRSSQPFFYSSALAAEREAPTPPKSGSRHRCADQGAPNDSGCRERKFMKKRKETQ